MYDVERADLAASLAERSAAADPQVRVSAVSGNYFSVLGVSIRPGRAFTEPGDGVLGESPVAIISEGYWRRRFNRAPDIVGQSFAIHSTRFTILGVAPRTFSGEWVGRPTDVWVPISMVAQVVAELPPGLPRGAGLGFRLIGRLQPGVSIDQAEAQGHVAYQQILMEQRGGPHATPERLRTIAEARISLKPAATGFSPQRASYWPPLALLAGVAGLVLLLACANVANLLLARSASREREISIRLAIGAERFRLVRQLLTESVALAAIGGAAGMLLARWGHPASRGVDPGRPRVAHCRSIDA